MRLAEMIRLLAAVFALAATQIGLADDAPVIPSDDLVFCTVCHGVQMMGNQNIEAPRLSEMSQWYVELQLHAFKNGWRGTHEADLIGMEMRPMAAALSDSQISEAAKFVSATRSSLPAQTIDGDVVAGEKNYASCKVCHGEYAEGNEALHAPALAGLNDWYLLAQLRNYRDGVRGSNPEDNYGVQMRATVQILGDDQAMQDVVRYITTLNSN
jgi:cytochrome c553